MRFFYLIPIILSACLAQSNDTNSANISETFDNVVFDVDYGRLDLEGGGTLGSVTIFVESSWAGTNEPEWTVYVQGGTLYLESICPNNLSDCEIAFLGSIPSGIPVKGKTLSGDLLVSQASEVHLETDLGNIHISEISDQIYANTLDGYVLADYTTADESLIKATNGQITLKQIDAFSSIDLETESGNISIEVPEGNYNIDLSSVSGSVSFSNITHDDTSQSLIKGTSESGDVTATGI